MREVMISIQPKWCEKIFNIIGYSVGGTPIYEKDVEVRRNKPNLETPFKAYVYCTKGKDLLTSVNGIVNKPNEIVLDLTTDNEIRELNGKVIGEFVCDKTTEYECSSVGHGELATTCGTCLTYDEIINYCNGNSLYGWHIANRVLYDEPKELGEFTGLRKTKFGYEPIKIKKAPQSWFYVEG